MILITSVGLAAGLVVSATGLATIVPDTPTPTSYAAAPVVVTSVGLHIGRQVSTSGLSYTVDTPVSSAFTVSIGKITSVGLYGGTNVSATGLYSQATVSPVTDIRKLYVGSDNSLSLYYVNATGGVIPVTAVYYGTQKVFGVA